MNTRLIGAITLIFLIIIALGLSLTSEREESVRIGVVTTLTTGAASIGNDMRDAFELAIEHMGGEMGGIPVTVVYEDDAFDPNVGRQKTERLEI